jgi:hypothetical protein
MWYQNQKQMVRSTALISVNADALTALDHLNPVACYLGASGLTAYLTHPYASPLFGDLSNLPPMLIQSGDSEVLRDEVTLLAHKATLAGVNVTHELYEDMVHVFQMFSFLPAATTAITSVGKWVRETLPEIEVEEKRRIGDVSLELGVEKQTSSSGDSVLRSKEDGPGITTPRRGHPASTSIARGGLRLDINANLLPSEQPSIDLDSLPASASPQSSRSGSPTPTRGSPTTLQDDPFDMPSSRTSILSTSASAPRLRRALTAITHPVPLPFTAASPPPASTTSRRRRRTQGAASLSIPFAMSASAGQSPSHSYTSGSSNPVSPTPSIRRALKSPVMTPGPTPTARLRSQSHSDIFHLVEEYVEGGAANETTVYSPGGEIRSVGVLGEDEEEE